jgi:hypothetical protein
VKRVLVVAHPDDEALWFGGLLIAEPGDWTCICCSIPRTDPIRAYKFFDACDVLGAKGRLLPFTEGEELDLSHLDVSGFDQVVTHGVVGEYGHRHHVQLNRHLIGAVTGRYGMLPGTKRIELTASQYERKVQALRCYDHTSPYDRKPKWQALLDRYGTEFDLTVETYDG